MGNLLKKQMKFALFVAAASAATMTFNDKCKTNADCGKFFNEQMICATWTESNPKFNGYKGVGKDCTIKAMCGMNEPAAFGVKGWHLQSHCPGVKAEEITAASEEVTAMALHNATKHGKPKKLDVPRVKCLLAS